jgi:hypothetical protein
VPYWADTVLLSVYVAVLDHPLLIRNYKTAN